MGFAITSAVFGGVTIICYSITIANYSYWYVLTNQSEKTVAAFILVLGIIEFTIGIWAAILGCMTGTCNCCGVPSNQVKYYNLNIKTQCIKIINIICCNSVNIMHIVRER